MLATRKLRATKYRIAVRISPEMMVPQMESSGFFMTYPSQFIKGQLLTALLRLNYVRFRMISTLIWIYLL